VAKGEIVWVFGSSGSGKATFLKYLCDKHPKDLIELLGWTDKKIIPCLESLRFIAQYSGDPLGTRREELMTVIPKLATTDDAVIIIKGQDLDLKRNRLLRLKKLLPYHKHRIIFLHTSIQELYKRWKSKPWWHPEDTEETVKEWLKPQITTLLALNMEFEITALDSSYLNYYCKIDFPPII